MADLWNDCKKLNSSLFDEIMAIINYDSADNNIESLLSICDSHLILKAKSPDELDKIKNFGGVLKCMLINGGQTKSNGDTVYLRCGSSKYHLLSPLPWAEYKAKRQIRQ